MVMFQEFLDEMNPEYNRTIPFLWTLNIDNDHIQFFADGAGMADLGFGCVYRNHWTFGHWQDTELFQGNFKPNIALLGAVGNSDHFEIWVLQLLSKTITLRSDNQATIHMI